MRVWTLHPKYLDSKGLVALWRETLLAKKVLEGQTQGYKKHPQLIRFQNTHHPLHAISYYLSEVFNEAEKRNYCFNYSKVGELVEVEKIPVQKGQVEYEFKHLLQKLEKRDVAKFSEMKYIDSIEVHPLFKIVEGGIESWEKL